MTSEVNFPIEVDGKTQMKKVIRQKANDYTEQVVYREKKVAWINEIKI